MLVGSKTGLERDKIIPKEKIILQLFGTLDGELKNHCLKKTCCYHRTKG